MVLQTKSESLSSCLFRALRGPGGRRRQRSGNMPHSRTATIHAGSGPIRPSTSSKEEWCQHTNCTSCAMFLRQAACQAALQRSKRESGSGPTADVSPPPPFIAHRLPHCNSWKNNLARTAHLGAGLLHQLQKRGAALRRAAVDEAGPQRAQVPLQRLEAVLQPPPGAAPRLELALLLRRPYEDGHLRDAQQRQILAGARLCPGCGGSTGAGSLVLETGGRSKTLAASTTHGVAAQARR